MNAAALRLVHLDEHCVVAEKPAGLAAVAGRSAELHDCLSWRVQQQVGDALVVHRLDMATSGLLLMARGLAMQRALARDFEARRIDKHYTASCTPARWSSGTPPPGSASHSTRRRRSDQPCSSFIFWRTARERILYCASSRCRSSALWLSRCSSRCSL